MTSALDTQEKGIPAAQIRAMLDLREETVTALGELFSEAPNRIAETISGYRLNRRIREKLSAHLNISYRKLWGEEQKNGKRDVASEPAGEIGEVTGAHATTRKAGAAEATG
jgi:hypothetical protein